MGYRHYLVHQTYVCQLYSIPPASTKAVMRNVELNMLMEALGFKSVLQNYWPFYQHPPFKSEMRKCKHAKS
jgi:hypothetical protein